MQALIQAAIANIEKYVHTGNINALVIALEVLDNLKMDVESAGA